MEEVVREVFWPSVHPANIYLLTTVKQVVGVCVFLTASFPYEYLI